ncbi:P-type conjugative transfer protein TrbJ [Candidatus Igneacidithiobacillus taiwanensis]|uniref:P-type conjugative transfer protein TrbJ n=1 Tax=Candidatus Igneacidithiobacillus taiwanensis TaxID=1945924 RepID=UPI0028A1A619|nr:P-type conjugative transfer protein TrbJ [Candidatus Igneacidithiobacillus taiwanensis]
MKSKVSLSIVGAMLALVSGNAFAGGAVTGGATFPEQITQEVTAVQSLGKQVEEVSNQIEQYANMVQRYENMVQNTLALPQATFDSIWNPLVGSIQKLEGLYSQAQALGYAGQNIGSQLAQEYQGAGASITNLSQNYSNWNASTNAVMEDTLQSYHLSDQEFATEDQSMATIQHQAATATGRAAIAGAAVAAANVTTKAVQQLAQITENANRAVIAYDKEKKAADNADAAASVSSMFGGATNSILP